MKPILTTKLHIPHHRSDLVARQRLVEKLLVGLRGPLTLISAPAGFGKTTLLVVGLAQCDHPIAWISLDAADNDPARWWIYLITALQQVEPGFGAELLERFETDQPVGDDGFLSALINALNAIQDDFVLVFDDYHVITEPKIQEYLLFVLDNQPHQMHVALASRADPPWPLARRRSRGEIVEIRTHEMRFTLDEARVLLNETMQFGLLEQDVAALETRTEGWIAGLQLAALSMRSRDDFSSFIRSFTGSHRFVMDYLIEEVLSQQSPAVLDFLLRTSILDRFNADLCDFLLQQTGSRQVLTYLDQANSFLVPLDDQRYWYRYHHLFADLLRQRLGQFQPDQVAGLQQRASLWYQEQGLLPEAVQYALAGDDLARVAALTEEMAIHRMDAVELHTLLAWLERLLPADFLRHPWLLVARCWAFLHASRYDQLETSLLELETLLAQETRMIPREQRLRGHLAAIRSYLAELRSDVSTAARQAEQALRLLPEDEYNLRAFIAIRWANCLAWLGEFDQAIRAYHTAAETGKLAGDANLALTSLAEMAVNQMNTGHLQQAVVTISAAREYGQTLARRDGRRIPAMGLVLRHQASILRELNDLAGAQDAIDEAIVLCQRWGEKESLFFSYLVGARVRLASGQLADLDDHLQRMQQMARQISPLTLRFARSWIMYFGLQRGRLDEVQRWAAELNMSANDPIPFERQFEYQNFARLLAAQGDITGALQVVARLLAVCEAAGALIYAIKYGIFQALLCQRLGRRTEMLGRLSTTLAFARREGYLRSILDEGPVVGELLVIAIAEGIEVDFAQQLLDALEQAPAPRQLGELAEPLSERELEVLRLLKTELDTPQIAHALVLSVNTVRSHIKSIYGKLGVHSRFEAVNKAQTLNLI